MASLDRRAFLRFLGRTGAAGISATALSANIFGAAAFAVQNRPSIPSIKPSLKDEVVLAPGLQYDILIRWGDVIGADKTFGFNNDYIACIALNDDKTDALLWVNHEYPNPLFVSDYRRGGERTREQMLLEQDSVGGSILRIRRDKDNGWHVARNDALNRRITGQTPIPFAWPEPIAGSKEAIGTLANCAGGVTPWGTILTCEENYDGFYGEIIYDDSGKSERTPSNLGWERFFPYSPEHYGWVVEIDPKTGVSKKLIGMGRCAHECASTALAKDGRTVVYLADDANDQCVYKFIAARPGSVEEGTLYVADTERGRWIPVDYERQPALRSRFSGQTEVLIRLREAAALLGGTPLDRPEDIDIDPFSGAVLICLSNNKPKGNYFGSILKITEKNNDHLALEFTPDTFLTGGPETGFACPDNLAFDQRGNVWFTSDISGSGINKKPYDPFGSNGLFVVPVSGPQAGIPLQIASCPVDAEFTGPCFSPDGSALFLSVQHPGSLSPSKTELTSHWPDGAPAIPRPAVVAITGPTLDRILRQG